MGDILSQMYLISARSTLRVGRPAGRRRAADALAIWDAMYRAQEAFEGVIANYPNRFFAYWLHKVIFPSAIPMSCPPTASATRSPRS